MASAFPMFFAQANSDVGRTCSPRADAMQQNDSGDSFGGKEEPSLKDIANTFFHC